MRKIYDEIMKVTHSDADGTGLNFIISRLVERLQNSKEDLSI